jgi:3-oxoacyl-[acyl-carrier protein] reductase
MRLADKVSIITGSGSGIGHATALKFAQEGAKVAVCDINEQAARNVAREITESGGEALAFRIDVTDKASIARMVEGVMAKWGRIDTLVNNAGIVQDAQLKKMTDDQFDNVIDVNLKGVYNCTKAVVDIMLEQHSGVILNASSIVGLYGNFGQTNYAASKFAVIEDKVPMGRLGRPEEIANTYAWLASDEASYINGAVIEVSGGSTL